MRDTSFATGILTYVDEETFIIPDKRAGRGSSFLEIRQSLPKWTIGIGFRFLGPVLSKAKSPNDEVACTVDILKVDTGDGKSRNSSDIADILPQGRYIFDASIAQAILAQISADFTLSSPGLSLVREGTVAMFTSSGVMFLRHMCVFDRSWLEPGFQEGGMTFVGPTNILIPTE